MWARVFLLEGQELCMCVCQAIRVHDCTDVMYSTERAISIIINFIVHFTCQVGNALGTHAHTSKSDTSYSLVCHQTLLSQMVMFKNVNHNEYSV